MSARLVADSRAGVVKAGPGRRNWAGLAWIAPAATMYGLFVLYPLTQTARYSLYEWDGFGEARFVGVANYQRLLTEPELRSSISHSFVLIGFFSILPMLLGLVCAVALARMDKNVFGSGARTVLFLPQVIPLVGAGIAWTWAYSTSGYVNQILGWLRLEGWARPWLSDFATALPAVGLIGTWVSFGFCTVLLLAGISRIDPHLLEAARLDGAAYWQELRHVIVPGLRREVAIGLTVTTVAALATFDIVYVSTNGGPGYATMVPGVEIYRLTFLSQEVGAASALALALIVLVLVVVTPIQLLMRDD